MQVGLMQIRSLIDHRRENVDLAPVDASGHQTGDGSVRGAQRPDDHKRSPGASRSVNLRGGL
jgi:hypothetical protein